MRPCYSSITPTVVHQHARYALERCLDWKPFHDSVAVADLLDLLLRMAASAASLFATVRRFFPFSHETAQRAVHANLPCLERLTAGIVQALRDIAAFSRRDQRRRWLAAIDLHDVPYYGRRNAYVVGGPKKQGTKWFYRYATAVLLHKRRRYTVALCAVFSSTKPHEVVRTLLDQIAAQGLLLRGVTLDSGFDSGDTLLLLQERGLAYAVPLRRKGNARNARNRCFEGRHRQVRWMEWTTEKTRRRVRTRTLLWKGKPQTRLFAFDGWSGDHACNVHRLALRQRGLYRRRFGIETSYRQKNQAKAFTTSGHAVYRLLLEGIAYLLRQVWVALTAELARRRGVDANAWIGGLPMEQMIDWLNHVLSDLHPEEEVIPLDAMG